MSAAEEAWAEDHDEIEVEYELADDDDRLQQEQHSDEEKKPQQSLPPTRHAAQRPAQPQTQKQKPPLQVHTEEQQQHQQQDAPPSTMRAQRAAYDSLPPTARAQHHPRQEQQQQQYGEEQKQSDEYDEQQQHQQQDDQPHQRQQQQPQQPNWDSAALHAAAHAAIASGDEAVVAQFLSLLEAHRARCERRHLYIEAGLAEEKLRELRAHEDARRLHALTTRHLAEKIDLEEAHILEFNEFNQVWGREILAPFDAETRAKQTAMLARHVEELEQWTRDQQEQAFMRPKFSKQLLALRTLQEAHGRAREYAQAERVRLQALQLERIELESLRLAWAGRVQAKRARFLETQARELHGFSARRNEERLALEARQRSELRVQIVQKYQNLSSELERAQAKERKKLEKMHQLGVSESSVLREEAPRRVHLPPPDDDENDGLDQGASEHMPPSARAASAGGAASVGRTRLMSSAAAARRRREEEQQWQQQQQQNQRPSSASSVPTISGAMSARHPGSGSGGDGGGGPSQQSQYPHPFTVRSSSAAAAFANGNGHAPQESMQQLLRKASVQKQQQQQPLTARPSTSSAYESSGRRPRATRPHRTVSAAIHYSRPATRAGSSSDRTRELNQVLLQGAPPAAAIHAMQQQQQQQHVPRPPSSSRSTPSGGSQLSYLDRMNARQTISQKVQASGGNAGGANDASHGRHPGRNGLPSISAAESAEREKMQQRRLQTVRAIMDSRRSLHSSSEEGEV